MKKRTTILDVKEGCLLISEPFLLDSYFKRAVIMIGEYSEDGTVGFIINKPTNLTINDALDDFPKIHAPLYFGGPVQIDTIHFIHRFHNLEGSKEIIPGVYWGGDLEQLKKGINLGRIKSEDVRFFAGYSGWEPQQLTEELKGHTWLISENNKDFVFSHTPEDLWGNVLKAMGSQYAILANFPEDPSLN